MAPTKKSSAAAAVRFVDAALSTTIGPLSLTYTHHNLRWLIRDHLLALLRDFPSLSPSADSYTHDDGTTLHLLNAHGPLPLSTKSPPHTIHLTIWLTKCYPFHKPHVYLSTTDHGAPQICSNHPFVDVSSGAVTSPYLVTWQYPRSNLSDLARNIVNVFTLCPPFTTTSHLPPPPPSPPAIAAAAAAVASKREATDRLYTSLHRDMAAFGVQIEEDIFSLTIIKSIFLEKSQATESAITDLEQEKACLKVLVKSVVEEADVLSSWCTVNKNNSVCLVNGVDEEEEEEFFEGADEKSRIMVETEAASEAIDDALEVMEEALGEGLVSFEAYMKQVRVLSREQFFCRAKQVKLLQREQNSSRHTARRRRR